MYVPHDRDVPPTSGVQEAAGAGPSCDGAGRSHRHWAFTLNMCEGEVSRASKIGEYDEAMLLDLPRYQFLGKKLEAMTRGRPEKALLLSGPPGEMGRFMARASAVLKLPLVAHPYQLRHIGASTDVGHGDLLIADVKRRGQWRADISVRRYERAGQLTRVFRMLSEAASEFCLASVDELPDVFYGRRDPRRFRGS